MTFHKRRDVTVLRAADEITFPMSRNRAVTSISAGRSRMGNRVDDLALVVSAIARMPRAANSPLEAKDAESARLFQQHSTRLDEHMAAVNRLVRHVHLLVLEKDTHSSAIRKLVSGDQSRIGVYLQIDLFAASHAGQRRQPLGPQGRTPPAF